MSLCPGLKKRMIKQSLPEYAIEQNNYHGYSHSICRETHICTRIRASYTLEAAIVIPLVASFFVVLLFFFRVLQIQTQVQQSLYYSSRKAASEATYVDSNALLLITAEGLFQKELHRYKLGDYILGGPMGISLLRSQCDDCYVDLQADYYIKMPIRIFPVKGIYISQESKSRKWIGDVDESGLDDYVYVTPYGTVYHRDRTCSYIDLSIHMVETAKIGGLRNKSEHKYHECSECVAKNKTLSRAYITDYGTVYHSDLSCSGLKRTIKMVPLSEVEGRGACSKCGGE